jgi:hypothetical protein
MLARLAAAALLAAGLRGCVTYEFEHEFTLRVDGSGSVEVTGSPELWAAFKTVGNLDAAKALFERSGLEVRRARTLTRGGRTYLYVRADFRDVNALGDSPAFPDLRLTLARAGSRLRLQGEWRPPDDAVRPRGAALEGLLAVRFHLPSKVYAHDNAVLGVERGNIVTWSQEVRAAAAGRPLAFGATIDDRSILLSTVVVFGAAIAIAAVLLVTAVLAVRRRGKRDRRNGSGMSPRV